MTCLSNKRQGYEAIKVLIAFYCKSNWGYSKNLVRYTLDHFKVKAGMMLWLLFSKTNFFWLSTNIIIFVKRFFVKMNAYSDRRNNEISSFFNMYFLHLFNCPILRSSEFVLNLFKDNTSMTFLGNKRQEYEVIKVFIALYCNSNCEYSKNLKRDTYDHS